MTVNHITLPDTDEDSPRAGLLSPWQPPRRSLSTGRSPPFAPSRYAAWRDETVRNAERIQRRVVKVWSKMSVLQRVLAVVGLVIVNVLLILFLIFNERIFGLLEPLAERWKHTTGGWTILWAITFLTAFPPVIGYSTCGTTAGFVYGVWEGWLILASATVAGSFCSFLLSRTVLRKWVERMIANDKRFAAFTLILKHDGLKLLCMIRLCPLPYSLSNGAMSTFPTVHPAMYALATAIVSPKLLIHVFIGSRLAVIARTREKMTMGDRLVNYSGIAIGATVGILTGLYIYRQTMARAKELEAEEANNVRDAVRRTGHLPPEYNDDPEAQLAANTLERDDDAMDYFDDSPNQQTEYHDEPTDDEDVFGRGDGDDEEVIDTISLHTQKGVND
ncbi:Tlg2-vesicle protein [Rhinocladiella similis]